MKHTFNLNIPADCEDPVKYVREAIESFQASQGELTGDISVKINTENHAIPQIVRAAIPEINIEDAYPKPGEPLPLRGCMKHAIIVDDAPYISEGKENVADLNKAPKVDIVIKDGDVVAVDMVKEYTPFIRKWAEDRNIIGGGSTTLDQFIKGLTEAGELWTHVGKGQHALLQDDIGDVYVCLVNAAGNLNVKLEEHVRPLEPQDIHVGRTLYQRRGLKRYSLQVLYGLAAVAQAIENILEFDNEEVPEGLMFDFYETCADVVYVLETIALEHDWSLTECIAAAYEDIRDRRGLMVNGTFVKEKDFTVEMVEAALADERTKEATREYLTQWMLGQIGKTAEKIGDAIEAKATDVRKPFWLLWNDARGNAQSIAPFELSDEIVALLNKAEGDQFVATLGVFGQINHNHEIFVIDQTELKTALNRLVGNLVGEVNNPVPEAKQLFDDWIKRICTIDADNSAGTLIGYAINELGNGTHGPIIEVVGLIEPSPLTKDRIATSGHVYFGIRSIAHTTGADKPIVNKVDRLVCFDLSIDNPREMK